MSLRDVLLDENIYPDPMEFRPARWLSDNPELERMSQFWVPFSRGSRMCLGIKYENLPRTTV
jgi:cytochrome P450